MVLLIIGCTSTISNAQYGYFYTGKDYGSEAYLSPFNVIMNGGFDMLQINDNPNRIIELHLDNGFQKVFYSLFHPKEAIDQIGWKKFTDSQLIPFGLSKTDNQWIPNYGLHLLGGGIEYARMVDFFHYYKVKNPKLYASMTVLTYHLFNEAVEHNEKPWLSYDAVADFYFFNIPGILLFNLEPLQYFFSHKVIIRNWSTQAAFVPSDGSIHNVGQYFSLKWKPFFLKRTSLFWYMGLGALFGIGYDYNGLTYSLGAGYKTEKVNIVNDATKQENIEVTPSFGVFVDKNNSLLGSLVYTGSKNYNENIRAEIFPGVIGFKHVKIGLWATYSYTKSSHFGITLGWLPGIGF